MIHIRPGGGRRNCWLRMQEDVIILIGVSDGMWKGGKVVERFEEGDVRRKKIPIHICSNKRSRENRREVERHRWVVQQGPVYTKDREQHIERF